MIEIDDSEKVLRVVRKHWFVLLGDIFILVFFLAIPMVLLFVLHLLPIENFIAFSGKTFYAGGFFFFAWCLVVWILGWNIWTDYYLDVLIITDKRIFDIDQRGLFRRTSSSFRLDRVQNVTVEMKGIIQTLLDFGTVHIETAGENEDFIATYIAQPYDIKKLINERQDAAAEKSQLVHVGETAPVIKPTKELV
jgi:uncharacterized membrane protein YdbT with pleckstrin-like domain